MGLALAMNQPLPEVPIYRAILYLPSVIPLFALSFIFAILMNPTQGIFNQILIRLGLPNINWFGDPQWTKLAFVFLAQFGAGQVALIFLAGLKGIPVTLYEAAMLDGAGVWSRFRNITLPMMTPVILYDLILGLSLGLQVFTQAYVITRGGPADASRFYVLYLYENAFRYGKMGYASAMAWILFVITFVLAMLDLPLVAAVGLLRGHVGARGRRWPESNRWRAPQPCHWTPEPSLAARRAGLALQTARAAGRCPGSC